MEYEELTHLIALTMIDNIGPVTTMGLVNAFGSPSSVFRASLDELAAIAGVSRRTATQIVTFGQWSRVEKEIAQARKTNVSLITMWDEHYPRLLRHIYDAPSLLYVKGEIGRNDINIGIVGSRNASPHGIFITDRIARALVMEGLTVVSGMARGIDSAAHTGALAARGRTIAVLGSGIDVIYPLENKKLFDKIASSGAVISEYPFATTPQGHHFPRRNRIISGLSLGVVVVEATEKSGSLITARMALEQGREVFAVPGSIDSSGSRGTNKLIKEGAKLVQDVNDIFTEILPEIDYSDRNVTAHENNEKNDAPALPKLSPAEKKMIQHINNTPVHIDSVIEKSGIAVHEALTILLSLEVQGHITQLPGKYFVIKE